MRTRLTRITVAKKGNPTFSEMATHVEVEDEPCGASYLVIRQDRGDGQGLVMFEAEEWPAIRAAVNRMIKEVGYETHPDV